MKKANQEKTKKIAVVAGLMAVGVLAVTGIFHCLHKEETFDYIAEESEMFFQAIEADTENEIIYPETEAEKELVIDSEAEIEVEKDLVIDNEVTTDLGNLEHMQNEPAQPLQKEPEKTENKKPTELPVEVADADIENADVQPENREIPAQTESQPSGSSDTQNGTVKDGKIYIDGFGWIDYNGGETDVVAGDGIYENGNTVGIMD